MQSGFLPHCSFNADRTARRTDSASSRFSRLKSLGVQLYLDDFGKG